MRLLALGVLAWHLDQLGVEFRRLLAGTDPGALRLTLAPDAANASRPCLLSKFCLLTLAFPISHPCFGGPQHAFERWELNNKIGYTSLVPMQTLATDIIDDDELSRLPLRPRLQLARLLQARIAEAVEREQRIHSAVLDAGRVPRLEPQGSSSLHCDNAYCCRELFLHYFCCMTCTKSRDAAASGNSNGGCCSKQWSTDDLNAKRGTISHPTSHFDVASGSSSGNSQPHEPHKADDTAREHDEGMAWAC